MNTFLTFKHLCVSALVLRLILLAYGEYQDAYFTVKYTDIDYVVFTDAARYITQGQSPYLRDTYRYTPLLAMLMTPNIYWFYSFGKCLFALSDLVVGYLIHQILVMRGMPSKSALKYDALWLLNPMVANISTRGNAESLLGVMVLGTLYLILTKRFFSGCCLFGLAVHFKIYPVIYAVPLLVLLDEQVYRLPYLYFFHRHSSDGWITPLRLLFGLTSGLVFFVLTGLMYQSYGQPFLQHTYLYHVTRQDHRHNFSLWFYQMYLTIHQSHSWMGLLAFIPQLGLVTWIGIGFGKDILFACFLQTFLFVTFNKVITSQYFMWYICLFPLVLPSSRIKFRWKGLSMLIAWAAGQACWLYYAYGLEFLGQNTFLSLWAAGVVFFVINCWIIVEFIYQHHYEPIYGSSGRVRWVWGMGDPGTKRL
ncbi:PIG-M-domain-containing protein [Choanephora cucurbitarum]|nr:PIG-M-domain-containing protein [Choanephora cucurbitarum]